MKYRFVMSLFVSMFATQLFAQTELVRCHAISNPPMSANPFGISMLVDGDLREIAAGTTESRVGHLLFFKNSATLADLSNWTLQGPFTIQPVAWSVRMLANDWVPGAGAGFSDPKTHFIAEATYFQERGPGVAPLRWTVEIDSRGKGRHFMGKTFAPEQGWEFSCNFDLYKNKPR